MSDYIPKDPYTPNDPRGYDRYGNARFEPADDTGKGPYILLGLLVAIGLIGGLLYFNGAPKNGDQVAQAPNRPAIERTMPTPAPAMPATPAAPKAAEPAAPATQDAPKQ